MYLEDRLNKFRRMLEDQLLATKGEISITDAATISTAVKWEKHAALCERWLRLAEKRGEQLKPADYLSFSREVARASTERDKALKQLNLDAPPKNPWELEDDQLEG